VSFEESVEYKKESIHPSISNNNIPNIVFHEGKKRKKDPHKK